LIHSFPSYEGLGSLPLLTTPGQPPNSGACRTHDRPDDWQLNITQGGCGMLVHGMADVQPCAKAVFVHTATCKTEDYPFVCCYLAKPHPCFAPAKQAHLENISQSAGCWPALVPQSSRLLHHPPTWLLRISWKVPPPTHTPYSPPCQDPRPALMTHTMRASPSATWGHSNGLIGRACHKSESATSNAHAW
jgi:hypothetical protein